MFRNTDHCVFTLTPNDVDRIKALLHTVEEAISELIANRCVRPLDTNTNVLSEDDVYMQASHIFANYMSRREENFFSVEGKNGGSVGPG
jgi:hypothetical protein